MGLLIKLQDGDTALKSLKFGNDRPGGGDSGQPYIKNPIEGTSSPINKDFLLRGGINAPLDAAEDVARLTKYFFDFRNPSGLLFTAKQNLLSRVAVKAEVAEKIPGNVPGPAYGGGTINEGIYTPLSTIAEAGVVAFGGHLNKQGLDPTGLLPELSIKKYGPTAFVLNEPQYNKWFESPAPTQDFVRYVPQTTSRFDLEESTADLNFSNRLLRLWYTKELPPTNNPNILSYSGGPNSTLGIGTTNIKFATLGDGLTPSRTGVNNIQFQTNKNTFLTGSTQQEIQVNKFYLNNVDGVPTYQETLDITKLLGASKLQDLPEDKIWYNSVTSESPQTDVFNYVINLDKALNNAKITALSSDPNYLTKKDLSLGLIERSSENTTYFSPINEILRNSGDGATQGVTGSGRQLIVDPQYILSSGSYLAVDPENKILGQYSSENTLWNDNLNQSANYSKPKDHKKGYLANLDKNSGYYYTKNGNYTFTLNQYARGTAPDFRLTSREVRGFNDYENTLEDETVKLGKIWGSYDAITTKGTNFEKSQTVDKIYYNSSRLRTSNPINNGKDLISFKIGITSPTSIKKSKDLQFKAYIDQFSDTYSNEWKPQTYMGRAEKQYKYNSFDRSISLGFTVVADNEKNLNEMYIMLNTLAASIAPTYTSKGYMAGNLHRLTLGNYLYEQWGIMNGGFTYEVTEESPWNINSGKQLPYYIKVTGVKFTPIHTFRPDYEYNNVSQYINQKP